MKTERHPEKEFVDLHRGMCIRAKIPFEMEITDVFDSGFQNYQNRHPWIIMAETEETVDVIMAQTLINSNEGKDNFLALMKLDWTTEIGRPCPPMDDNKGPNGRRQSVDATTTITVPKTVLYEDDSLEICNNGGLYLNEKDLGKIDRLVRYYFEQNPDLDPRDLWNTQEVDYPVDNYVR